MSRDLRKYAGQTNIRLIIGGILLFFFVGIGLIYGFYGGRAAIMGFLCMFLAVSPLFLIWIVLWILEWLAKRVEQE